MNRLDQLENELKHHRETIVAIEECLEEARDNEDSDLVIPEYWATRLKMLLENL